jgi:hypothetical protein
MTWIASLWSSSFAWEGVEYVAETVVVICALIEVLADFEHILKGDENKTLRKSVEKRAAIGLVLGLAIGLVALVRTNSLFTDEIASAHREAREASDRAADASGKAKTASDRADKAETQAGVAIKQAAILNKQAEDERMARIKIEERVAWRHLTKEQQSEIANRLKRFSGQWGNIGRVSYDAEITSFATDIAQTLNTAGWHVLPPSAISIRETRAPAFGNPIELSYYRRNYKQHT